MPPHQDFNRTQPGPYNSLRMHSSGRWSYFDEPSSAWVETPFSELSMPTVSMLNNPAAQWGDIMLWYRGILFGCGIGIVGAYGVTTVVRALKKRNKGDGNYTNGPAFLSVKELMGRLRGKKGVTGEEEGRKIRMEGFGSERC